MPDTRPAAINDPVTEAIAALGLDLGRTPDRGATYLALNAALSPAAIAALGAVAEERAGKPGFATALAEGTTRNLIDLIEAEAGIAVAALKIGDRAGHQANLLAIALLAVIGLERLFHGRPL